MVVVTSPITVHAPPAFAAMTMREAKQQAVVALGDQPLDQRDHDDGGGQIVEDCTEEEGNEANQPYQTDLAGRADAGGDDLETVMGVDDLDDGHRANQEEHDLRGGSDGLVKLTADQRVVAGRERVDCPEHARAE
ncbi:hypothetical protein ACVWZV_006919 [Bradyrhizobium sp. GM5.1]